MIRVRIRPVWRFQGKAERDFDFADWVDPRPLAAAHKLRAERRQQGR